MADVQYYRGVHKVKVVTKSEGYWIVEALEDFEDTVNDKRVQVRTGEKKIVPVEYLHQQKTLPPAVKEHVYELQMEKRLKRLIFSEEKKKARAKVPRN